MSGMREVWSHAVAGALEAHAVAVEQMAPGHWTFALGATPAVRVSAQLAEAWLLFDAPLPPPLDDTVPCGWSTLAANALLTGRVRVCTAGTDPTLRLRAELPLSEDIATARRVRWMCASMAVSVRVLAPHVCHSDESASSSVPGDADPADVDVQQLCSDAQWPFTPREPNAAMVALDVQGTFQQALVEPYGPDGLRVSVPLLAEAPVEPVCATAVARLLLATAGAVRMVRAVTRTPQPCVFEVMLDHHPLAEEVAHALAALSVAWRVAGREADVLAHDAAAAAIFLEWRDLSAPPYEQAERSQTNRGINP